MLLQIRGRVQPKVIFEISLHYNMDIEVKVDSVDVLIRAFDRFKLFNEVLTHPNDLIGSPFNFMSKC